MVRAAVEVVSHTEGGDIEGSSGGNPKEVEDRGIGGGAEEGLDTLDVHQGIALKNHHLNEEFSFWRCFVQGRVLRPEVVVEVEVAGHHDWAEGGEGEVADGGESRGVRGIVDVDDEGRRAVLKRQLQDTAAGKDREVGAEGGEEARMVFADIEDDVRVGVRRRGGDQADPVAMSNCAADVRTCGSVSTDEAEPGLLNKNNIKSRGRERGGIEKGMCGYIRAVHILRKEMNRAHRGRGRGVMWRSRRRRRRGGRWRDKDIGIINLRRKRKKFGKKGIEVVVGTHANKEKCLGG